jgi:hypothetical protein
MSYTVKEVAILEACESVSFEQAVQFGKDFDKSHQSVISKVQSLEIPYIKKAVPAPKPVQLTKAQLVASIAAITNGLKVEGLQSATREALVALEDYLYS